MPKALLIVESPAKAKTIKKYVGDDYEVLASKGHIKDLPKRGGVDVEQGFQETYELLEEKGKPEVVKAIKAAAKKVGQVLLATDPDREGEAIAYHLAEVVKDANKGVEVQRVLFNEITKKGVTDGLEHPRVLDTNLYEAQRTRRVLDRIGGYPLSNLLWTKLTFGLSAGRVQTPALRLIVDRQREHDEFIPQNYWLVEAHLEGPTKPPFIASLVEVDGQKLEKVASRPAATSEPQAAKFVSDLRKASYSVKKVQKREQKRRAPAPYTTSKLQQDASSRLGMKPKRTMRIAQQLYEGVTIGRGKNAETVGLITYMRTDSVRLSNDAIDEGRAYVESRYGKDALPETPNVFKSKKQNVQDAHEAIRPTSMAYPPDDVAKALNDEQLRLYRLIWDRFVACQMNPAIYDQTGVEIEGKVDGKSYGLRVSGSVLRVAGWRAVYGASAQPLAGEEGEDEKQGEERLLPPLAEGDALTLVEGRAGATPTNAPEGRAGATEADGAASSGVQSLHKQTEPPPLFSEAALVKKLEEEGIGRPSTYAEIISKVQARDYVQNKDGKLVASDLGKLVVEKLVDHHFDLADIGFTSKLEESLDAVAEGRAKRLDVLAPFHVRLQAQIEDAKGQKGKWWPEPEILDEKCPECGNDLTKRWGRNGVFIGCSNYPECKYTRNIIPEGETQEDRTPELTDYDCQLCGSKMMKRWGRNGFFLGCSSYPKCKGTRPVPLGFKCPKCKTGDIIEIRARGRGRTFYGCTNYNSDAKCDFRIWQKPVAEPCPQCGTQFLVRAGKKDDPILKCVSDTCSYERPYDLDDAGPEAAAAPDEPKGEAPSRQTGASRGA
jgi:DNA topoisomerase-1